ncbi:MAG: hypothetical protein V4519_03890 [Patescibacteria group bacterium]
MNTSNPNGTDVFRGDLITVGINVVTARGDPVRKVRFFQPKALADVVGIGPRDADRYFRYIPLEQGEQFEIVIGVIDPVASHQCSMGVDGLSVSDSEIVPVYEDVDSAVCWDDTANYIFNVGEENGGTVKGWRKKRTLIPFVAKGNQQSHVARMFRETTAVGTIVIAVFRETIDEWARKAQKPPLPRNHERYQDVEAVMPVDDAFVTSGCAYELILIRYAPASAVSVLADEATELVGSDLVTV